ncbi:unnamed protein product [Notodromas monacha]|uniref:Protein DIS3 homolog n=1 Tax=Notodromas monacha TaxID=399045 RepID=A0A7R9BJF1_9CRUS|nr:unnamed protein product [Notodromas monacha]CAG0916316.1 unnamed protein product [Notodromas monacha]
MTGISAGFDAEIGEEVLLEGKFSLFPRSGEIFDVRLTRGHFQFASPTRTESVSLSDVVGCLCMRRKGSARIAADPGAYFGVYCYPLSRKRVGRGFVRKRLVLAFLVNSAGVYDENLRVADSWRKVILAELWKPRPTLPQVDCLPDKKFLILVNPASGPGKALEIFMQRVRPVLAEAAVGYDLVVTERRNHARDLVADPSISHKYSGIVIVSGDGLIHEVYNGLFSQKEWQSSLQFPVGVIPGGSGNALAKCISYHAKEPYEENPALVSALNLVWHTIVPMDLMLVQTKGRTYCSFLSVGHGLLADIDIESEKLRVLGETRFTVWAVARLANLRTYRCRVSFEPSPMENVPANDVSRGKMTTIERQVSESPRTPASGTSEVKSDESRKSGLKHSQSYGGEAEKPSRSRLLSRGVAGVSFEEADEVLRDASVSACDTELKEVGAGDTADPVEVDEPGRLKIPGLDEPVPDHWHVIEEPPHSHTEWRLFNEIVGIRALLAATLGIDAISIAGIWKENLGSDEMVVVYAVIQSHINSDGMLAPKATLSDGNIWLMFIQAGIPKAQLLKVLVSLSDGSYLKCPHVTQIPVKAFRIEPSTSSGYMTVDGERIPVGPIQAEVMPSAARDSEEDVEMDQEVPSEEPEVSASPSPDATNEGKEVLVPVVPDLSSVDMEKDIMDIEAPRFTTLHRPSSEALQSLAWGMKAELIGGKVSSPMIHCCSQCNKPILIYGRMIPCKHVFCVPCALKEKDRCKHCRAEAERVDNVRLGFVFMCTEGGTRYGTNGCRRTYMSQRDLQAHMNHRHAGPSSSKPSSALDSHVSSHGVLKGPVSPASTIGGAKKILSPTASSSRPHNGSLPLCGIPIRTVSAPRVSPGMQVNSRNPDGVSSSLDRIHRAPPPQLSPISVVASSRSAGLGGIPVQDAVSSSDAPLSTYSRPPPPIDVAYYAMTAPPPLPDVSYGNLSVPPPNFIHSWSRPSSSRMEVLRTQNVFVKKTRGGSIQKVVREHYLRDDLWCGSQLCRECRHDVPVLEKIPESISSVCTNPHYLIPDHFFVLEQIDVLEAESIRNCIILSTVLHEVKRKSGPTYKRLRDLISNPQKRETHVKRKLDESEDERNLRAMQYVCRWYENHLNTGEVLKSGQPSLKVVLISGSEAARDSARNYGVSSFTVKEYVEAAADKFPELCDKVSQTSKSYISDQRSIFPPHLTPLQIKEKLKRGEIKQGSFNASRENYLEGFVNVEGIEKPILIQGMSHLNRVMHDDVVVVEILPEDKWVGQSGVVLDDPEEDKGDAVDDAEVALPEKSADVQPTGKIVGIIRRKWRQYCGILQPSAIKEHTKHLFIPAEKRIPKIRIETRQAEKLATNRIVVQMDEWPRHSRYPLGHYVRSLGKIGDKATENEVLLLEHDVPHSKFSENVLKCLPKLPWGIEDSVWEV